MAVITRNEIAEKSFVIREERSFRDRARADRAAGLWIAGRLGLAGTSADGFAAAAVDAGVRAPGGRGGFDHLVPHIARAGINIEELRTRYAMLMASDELPAGFIARLDGAAAAQISA